MMIYSPEYRATKCVQCAKDLAAHRRYTADDVAATAGATFKGPVIHDGRTYYSPISPSCIGEWIGHKPMPWRN